MNRLLLSFVLAIITFMHTSAQAPKGINYQGVARDNEGKPIVSKNISVRISILKMQSMEKRNMRKLINLKQINSDYFH
jgi:hypothetical protein